MNDTNAKPSIAVRVGASVAVVAIAVALTLFMNNLGFRDHYISPADRAAVLVGRAFVAVCVSVVVFAASGRVRVAGFVFGGASLVAAVAVAFTRVALDTGGGG